MQHAVKVHRFCSYHLDITSAANPSWPKAQADSTPPSQYAGTHLHTYTQYTNAESRHALGNIVVSQIHLVRANSNLVGPASYRIRCKCSICSRVHCSVVVLGVGEGPSVKVPVSSLTLNLPEMGHLVLKKPCGGCFARGGPLQARTEVA